MNEPDKFLCRRCGCSEEGDGPYCEDCVSHLAAIQPQELAERSRAWWSSTVAHQRGRGLTPEERERVDQVASVVNPSPGGPPDFSDTSFYVPVPSRKGSLVGYIEAQQARTARALVRKGQRRVALETSERMLGESIRNMLKNRAFWDQRAPLWGAAHRRDHIRGLVETLRLVREELAGL